jgi:hypothetical protein
MRGMVVYRIYSTLATTLTGSMCTQQSRWPSRLLSLLVLAALIGCSDPPTDTPPAVGTATLQQTAATFTSVEVRVIANGFDGHPTLRIVIDDTLLIGGFGVPCDTTITIANLLPSTAYRANVSGDG